MKKSLKNFVLKDKYKGYTILVYGELWEEGYVDGIILKRARFSKDGQKVMDESKNVESILLNRPYTRTRYFNMGWAICSPDDKFNENYGIELCKRRFRKSPLKTETGLFLTKDMVYAIIRNEIEYIKRNWRNFVKKEQGSSFVTAEDVINAVKKLDGSSRKDILNELADQKNEPATIENGLKPYEAEAGEYVRILNPEKSNWPETIGFVKKVCDGRIYYSWVVKYGENNGNRFCSFRHSAGIDDLYTDENDIVQPATKEEVSNALISIEKYTNFRWNVATKQIEAKII